MGRMETDEIDLREVFQVIVNGKKIIAGFAVLALIFAVSFTYLGKGPENIKTVIAYQHEGIEEGLGPAGAKLNVDRIRSPLVLASVVERSGLREQGITVEELRRNIEVLPVIPELVRARRQKALEGGEVYVYFPSEYMITLRLEKGLGIDKLQGKEILDSIVDEYRQYFRRYYSDETIVADELRDIDLDTYDHPQAYEVLNNQIGTLINYLRDQKSKPQGGTFRSLSTGYSFDDIIGRSLILKNVDLPRMNALIDVFSLTKNRAITISIYENRIREIEREKNKYLGEFEVALERKANLDKGERLVLVSGTGAPVELDASKQLSYYDKLAERATDARVAARSKAVDIQYYQDRIQRLKEVQDSPQRTKAKEEVFSLMGNVKHELNDLIGITEKTTRDLYDLKFSMAVNSIMPPQLFRESLNLKRNSVLAVMFGLFLGVFAVFIRSFWKDMDTKEDNS